MELAPLKSNSYFRFLSQGEKDQSQKLLAAFEPINATAAGLLTINWGGKLYTLACSLKHMCKMELSDLLRFCRNSV